MFSPLCARITLESPHGNTAQDAKVLRRVLDPRGTDPRQWPHL